MNSRERVNAAIERRPHDRVPRYETFWEDTIQRWIREGLCGGRESAWEALGADMAHICGFPWPAPFPGREEILSEDEMTRLFKDEWGATLRLFKDHQTTPEHLGWECDSKDAWHSNFRERVLNAAAKPDIEGYKQRYAAAQKAGQWTFFRAVEPFESLRKLIGDEEMMISIKEEPDWIVDMSEVTTSRSLKFLEALLDHGLMPDGLWIYGDMAFNHATFCSPADYRELIWPQHKRLCDWAHERGMKTIYHTDGNINGVVDLLIEAGVDVLQPLECKAGMDLRRLVPQFGSRVSFFGNIDVMVLIRGDLDEIEEEVRTKLEAGKQNSGYLFHSDHSVPPQVSWVTYREIIRMLDQYGSYS